MTQETINYLMSAGHHFAQAAAEIFSAIEDCNKLSNKNGVAKARIFNLSLAKYYGEQGFEHFKTFMIKSGIGSNDLDDVPHTNNEFI